MEVSCVKFRSIVESLESLEDLETLGHISLYQPSLKSGKDLPPP